MKLALVTAYAFLALLIPREAYAEYLRVPYEGIRQLGMGNAFIALADDANAIWYNPAALADVKGLHIDLFNLTGAVDSEATLNRVTGALFQGNYANLVPSSQEFIRANTNPSITGPYFGLMVFDNLQGMFNIGNLTNTNVDIYSVNDAGAILGFALPASEEFSIGASVRVFERTGVDTTITPQQLVTQLGVSNSNFNSAVYSYLTSLIGSGYGIGANLGTLLKVPLPSRTSKLQFAATIEDVGDTKIHTLSGPQLPSIPMTYNLGMALTNRLSKDSQLNFLVDYRNGFSSVPLFEQIHVGAEYRLKYFSLRAGYYEGYPTFGFSLDTPVHTRINLASYAVEEGSSLWQNGQRIYLAQLIIGFNPF